jgi:hypothetical protein
MGALWSVLKGERDQPLKSTLHYAIQGLHGVDCRNIRGTPQTLGMTVSRHPRNMVLTMF